MVKHPSPYVAARLAEITAGLPAALARRLPSGRLRAPPPKHRPGLPETAQAPLGRPRGPTLAEFNHGLLVTAALDQGWRCARCSAPLPDGEGHLAVTPSGEARAACSPACRDALEPVRARRLKVWQSAELCALREWAGTRVFDFAAIAALEAGRPRKRADGSTYRRRRFLGERYCARAIRQYDYQNQLTRWVTLRRAGAGAEECDAFWAQLRERAFGELMTRARADGVVEAVDGGYRFAAHGAGRALRYLFGYRRFVLAQLKSTHGYRVSDLRTYARAECEREHGLFRLRQEAS